MSNLNNTASGRVILRDIWGHLSNYFASRRLRRRFYRSFRQWFYGDHGNLQSSSFADMVADLNTLHDTEIEQVKQIGARFGMASESVQDETYYVDPVNGSDTTGNGTVSYPFASLDWLQYYLPRRIDHQYRVLILGDVSADTVQLSPEFGANGSLAIIGVGAPTVGDSRVVNTVTNYAAIYHNDCTVGGLSDDLYTGYWLRKDSGTIEAHPIFHHNAAGEFKTQFPWDTGLGGGQDISFVVPQHTITLNGLSIGGSSPRMVHTSGGEERGTRIGFFNLNIDVRGSAIAPAINMETSSGVMMSFVRVLYDDNNELPMRISNTYLNSDRHFDESIATLADCGLSNINTDRDLDGPAGLSMQNTDGHSAAARVVNVHGTGEINAMMCRQYVQFIHANYRCRVCQFNVMDLEDSNLWCESQGVGSQDPDGSIILERSEIGWSQASIFNYAGGLSGIISGPVGAGAAGQNRIGIGQVDLAGAAPFAECGLLIRQPTWVHTVGGPTLLTGATADIRFYTAAAPANGAWPGAGLSILDANSTSMIHRRS